jgi:hypothetical protein
MDMKKLAAIVMVAIVVVCISIQGRAQTSSATISGHIVDQAGGIVVSAEVKLVDQHTGVAVTTHVREDGDFIFPDVQPGTFAVIVQAPGFKELKQVDLRLSASQNLSTGTLRLQVGQVSESITVQADITPLQTTSSERSGVLDTEQLDNLLVIGRDAIGMLRVIPGVVGGGGASSLSTTTTPTVNGVNSAYNLATVDGGVGNTRGGATLDTPLNLDAVQEVTLLGSNYQAAYGATAGGNFNFVTKNGTQKFHGGVYEYFRNEDLNANTWVNKFGTDIPRARYRYNTLGGTIGGPVYWPRKFNRAKDKLFFFVSVEDSPIKTPDGIKYYRVPTALEAAGDFSQTYNQNTTAAQGPATLVRIKDPSSSEACPVNSATPGPGCFPGNVIPAQDINPQSQLLLQIMYQNTLAAHPENAFTDLSVSGNSYNYVTNNSADKPVNQEIFRIDYAPTEKLHMFGRGNLTAVNNNGFSSPANNLPWLMRVNYKNTEPNFVYNITYSFSPTIVNELNLGTAGWSERQLYAASDLAKVTLSTSGFNLPSLYPDVNPLNLFPGVSFAGTSSLQNAATYGWDSRFPMADQVRSYDATDNVTKIIGTHVLKFGVYAGTDAYLQVNHNRVGTFNFGRDSSNSNDSNFAYANTLLGHLDTYTQDTALLNYDPRTNAFEWYEQDTWKVRPNLTLDFGIRNSWAIAQRLAKGNNFVPSLFNPADAPVLYQYSANGKNAVDPTTGAGGLPKAYAGLMVPNTGNLNNGVLYVNTKGYPQGTVYGNGVLWAPRVGFAYSVLPKTVIRGGFGMFYNVRSGSGQEGDLTNNAPTTNGPTQYYSSVNANASDYYLNAGSLNGPFSINHALPLHAPELYTEETSLGVQQEIPYGAVLDVAYVGTFTRHATAYYPINEVPYGAEFEHPSPAGGLLPDNFYRPYPGFGTINYQKYNLTASYNSLQVRLTRRFNRGLEFGGAYTFSRSMDYGTCAITGCSDAYNFTSALYQNQRAWNYGPASYDIKHNLVVNYLWSLPRASRVWNNFVTRGVLDNWQISGIASHLSGAPAAIALSLSNGQNVTGGGDGARVVLTCDPWHHAPHKFAQWFNTGCVEAPLAGTPATLPSAGNPNGTPAIMASTGSGVYARKASFFLPDITNFDTALFKNMPLEGNLRLQLRVETYNTFNHTEFNAVNGTATFANANSQDPTINPQTNSTFGQLTGTANPRYMQIALRLDF